MKTKPGDIVFSTCRGHITKWIVVGNLDQYNKVRLYEYGCDRFHERLFDLTEDELFPTKRDAIKQAITEENEVYERNYDLHGENLKKLFEKLGETYEEEESHDNP